MKRSIAPFLIVVFSALLLRIWGIWNVSTTDEYNEVLEALRVCSGHINLERWIKRFYLYILAVEYGTWYVINWLLHIYSSPMDFAAKIVRNMEPLFILARLTSALAGAATVAVLFRIGEKFYSKRVGILASVLLTITLFHIDLSQQAKVDALLGLLVTLSLYSLYLLLNMTADNKGLYIWSGIFIALSIQTKVNSVIVLLPLAVVLAYRAKEIGVQAIGRGSAYFLAGFAVGFVLGNPPVLIAPVKFIQSILGTGVSVYTSNVNIAPSDSDVGFIAYPFYYFKSMGLGLTVLTGSAIVYSLLMPNRTRAMLLVFIGAFFILMGPVRSLVAPYYLIPVIPAIYLLTADVCSDVYERLIKSRMSGYYPLLVGVILILVFIQPVKNTLVHEMSLFGKNTRYVAKEWIEKNIPIGSKVLMDSGKSINSFAPPIAENEVSLVRVIDESNKRIANGKIVHGMVDKNAMIYYELLLKTVPPVSYDVTSTMFGLQVESIDYYLANGYHYFIISREMRENRLVDAVVRQYPEVAKFYTSLDTDPRISLIKTIAPTELNTGGTFFIYRAAPTSKRRTT